MPDETGSDPECSSQLTRMQMAPDYLLGEGVAYEFRVESRYCQLTGKRQLRVRARLQ
jgi:hypothetical protein